LVVGYYRDQAVLTSVDGRRDIDAVTVDLLAAIEPAIGSRDQGR